MVKKVFITGASGFVGSHCVPLLVKADFEVTAAVRKKEQERFILKLLAQGNLPSDKVSFVYIDLNDDAKRWNTVLRGFDFLMHLASPVPVAETKTPDVLIKTITQGTKKVIDAAVKNKLKHVVMTSSITTIYHGNVTGDILTESDWTKLDEPNLPTYSKAKTLAEKMAWEIIGKGGNTKLTTIMPGLILGPALHQRYSGSVDLIVRLMNGTYPGIPRLGWPIVDVRDVACMHVLCLDNEKAWDKRFICTDHFVWIKDVARVLREEFPAYRRKIPLLSLPGWVVRLYALFDVTTRLIAPELGQKKRMSNERAKKELGWEPKYGEHCVKASALTLMELGVIKARK